MATLRSVTADTFEAEVIAGSADRPVLVDFWAPWCAPCRMLAPVLEELADEFGEKLRIVKVNTDEEPALAQRFDIRGIPALKLFSKGAVVAELIGAHPASVIRATVAPHLPRESDAARLAALTLAEDGDYERAIAAMREVVASDPQNTQAALDLVRLLARAGRMDEAEEAYATLPAALQLDPEGRAVKAFVHFKRLAGSASPSSDGAAARRAEAAQALLNGDVERALDQWLELMQSDRNFARGAGRDDLLQAFEFIGLDDPRLPAYRRRLAALLH